MKGGLRPREAHKTPGAEGPPSQLALTASELLHISESR